MSCSHCQELGQLADPWLLNGCSLLCSISGGSLLVDLTFDINYNSKVSIPNQLTLQVIAADAAVGKATRILQKIRKRL